MFNDATRIDLDKQLSNSVHQDAAAAVRQSTPKQRTQSLLMTVAGADEPNTERRLITWPYIVLHYQPSIAIFMICASTISDVVRSHGT